LSTGLPVPGSPKTRQRLRRGFLQLDCYSGIPPNPEARSSGNKFDMSERFAGQTAHWLVNFPAVAGSEEQQLKNSGAKTPEKITL